jgi:hypothetical protein
MLTVIFPTFYRNEILTTIVILNISLPIFVDLTLMSGIIDGKIRFKRIITIQHIKKMIIGSVLLALAISLGVISFFLPTATILIPLLFISLFCVVCAGLLGLIGRTLKCIAFPN